jgi:rubrerythrin
MRNLIEDILKKESEHFDDLSKLLKTLNLKNIPAQVQMRRSEDESRNAVECQLYSIVQFVN